jgi:hypothetical protein
MAGDFSIRGDGLVLTLRVARYQFPQIDSGSDANWMVAVAELQVGHTGTFAARQELSLFTTDLAAFRDGLRRLDHELTGVVTLEHLEEQIEVTIALTAGRGEISGRLSEHGGASLAFRHVKTDQTYLRRTLGELEALMAAFPVRGDP